MYERTRSPSSGYNSGYTNATAKMANDIGPRKTMFVLVVVVGCFAILWPKVFYPMLVGSANQQIKPSKIDKTTGCCDVFSEVDIDTIKIMSELCSSIIQQTGQKPLSGKEIVSRCKTELQQTCGIDISAVLQEQFRLGRSVKQILSEVRSLNGSLCLKYHYGVAPWSLGVPHRIAVNLTSNVKQERPPHMRPDIIHPAFREKGSAIPKPATAAKRPPKIVEGRPGPIPGMRPTLGGAGHVIPSQKTGSSMSVIMPIYTIGIVIFFSYTLMKLLFKKQPDGVGGSLYPPVEPDPRFRREVFESERCKFTPRLSRDPTGKIVVNAMSALLDEVNQEIEARRIANQAKSSPNHSLANGNLANGSVPKRQDQEQTSVKILGMETTASCEGGEKWNKSIEPVVPVLHVTEPHAPPQEIYLQGALPAQSQILVTESAVVTEPGPSDINTDPAVVLAGKMTLSVISLDSTHENEKPVNEIKPPSVEIQPAVDPLDLNGEGDDVEEEPLDESKYTTASSATAAENEISEDEGTDNEVLDDEDIEKINDLEIEMNHIPGTNGTTNKDDAEDNIEEDIEEIGINEEDIGIKIEAGDEDEEEIEEIEIELDEEAEEIEIVEDRVIEIDEDIKDEAEVKTKEKANEEKLHEDEKTIGEEEVKIDEKIEDEEWVKENVEEVQIDTAAQVSENVKEYVIVKDEEIEQYEEEIKTVEEPRDNERVKEEEENVRKTIEKPQNDERVKDIEIVEDEKVSRVIETDEDIKNEDDIMMKENTTNEEKNQEDGEPKGKERVEIDKKIQDEEQLKETKEEVQMDTQVQDLEKVNVKDEEIVQYEKEIKTLEQPQDDETVKERLEETEEEVQIDTEVQVLENVNTNVNVKDEEIAQYEKEIKTLEPPQDDERVKERLKETEEEVQIDTKVQDLEEVDTNVNVKDEEIVQYEKEIKTLEQPQDDERVKEQLKETEEEVQIDTEVQVLEEVDTNVNVKDEELVQYAKEIKTLEQPQDDERAKVEEEDLRKTAEKPQNDETVKEREEEVQNEAKLEKDTHRIEDTSVVHEEAEIKTDDKILVRDDERTREDEEEVETDANAQFDKRIEVTKVKVGENIQNGKETKSIAETEDKDKVGNREEAEVEDKKVEDNEKLKDEEKLEIDKRTITEGKVNELKSEG